MNNKGRWILGILIGIFIGVIFSVVIVKTFLQGSALDIFQLTDKCSNDLRTTCRLSNTLTDIVNTQNELLKKCNPLFNQISNLTKLDCNLIS